MSTQGNQGSVGGGDFRADGTVPMRGNILPDVDSERHIGNPTNRFAEVHADRVVSPELVGVPANIAVLTSAAGLGGAASEIMTVTGLLASDTILAVTQKTKGANDLPLLGWSTQAANALTGIWSADPGAGSVIQVAVKRL